MAIGVRHHKITSKSQQLFKARVSVIGISRKKRSQPSSLAEVRVVNMEARKVTIQIMLPMLPRITVGRVSGTGPLRMTTMRWIANNRFQGKKEDKEDTRHQSRTTRGKRRRNLKRRSMNTTNFRLMARRSEWTKEHLEEITAVVSMGEVLSVAADRNNISRILAKLTNRGDKDRRPDLVHSRQ